MDARRSVRGNFAREKAVMDDLVSQTRDVVERSVGLLRAPRPDTFLGRKMQKPFPQEPFPNESEAN